MRKQMFVTLCVAAVWLAMTPAAAAQKASRATDESR